MEAPRDHAHFLECAQAMREAKGRSDAQLFGDAEAELRQQANFMRQQHALIDETVRDFRQVLCRINIYEHVAQMFRDPRGTGETSLPDMESSRLESLNQPLISQEILETTQIVYLGGVIDTREVLTMKKLLFRATRGKAILTTFELLVEEQDQVRGENFAERLMGYVVMFE